MSEFPSPEEAGLTTGALARRLGVAPTTLRSWDRRYGIGPAVRADGRHRRWRPQDVAVLEAMCRLTAAGVPPAEAARTAREGARAAREEGVAAGPVPEGGAAGPAPEGGAGPVDLAAAGTASVAIASAGTASAGTASAGAAAGGGAPAGPAA
ncbi:MerR family transcriptional regulator, partial [Streptomyces sp. NPDC059894]